MTNFGGAIIGITVALAAFISLSVHKIDEGNLYYFAKTNLNHNKISKKKGHVGVYYRVSFIY